MTIQTIKIVVILSFCLLVGVLSGCSEEDPAKEFVYVGTFDDRGSEGLYVFEFDRESGGMTQIQTVSDRPGPNFQAIHPGGKYLYSVSGDAFSENIEHGTISAYQVDSQTGMLQLINEQSVEGRGTAHVSVDPLGEFAYVSNYSEGNLSVFTISENGGVSEAVDVVQHEGSSVNERRQNAPHVHSIIPSADGRFIYVSDLGTDQIVIYEVDRTTGELSPAEVPYVESTPGSGPRHFTIHPGGEFAYSAEELSSTVAVFSVNQNNGALEEIQRITMLPEGYDGNNSAADIHLSPDGGFLYASNRGHDSLVIYRVDAETGALTPAGHEPTRGSHPRNFMIDQLGEYVLVANRDDDNVVVFNRDQETGQLTYSGEQVTVPMAVCVTQYFISE
ncbi:lactonase family protein [Rhodohalobacter sp. 8-1]|uniref:lactonase family protein n=1 Tax=Rhodohalobacter sp. 8-1 TaxID=3131972 RepID=UPI0030EEFA28